MPKPFPAQEIIADAAKLPEAPVYGVYGDEEYLRRRALESLCAHLSARGFEVRRVEVGETAAPLLDELRSPSLFGGALALVVKNRREGARQEATTRFKDELAAYLESPSRRNVLVFEGVTWQRNLTVPKRVGERFPTIEAAALKPWDERGFLEVLESVSRDLGLRLDRRAASALREACGGNLARAANELEKLGLLADGGPVTAEHVAQGCGYEGMDATFALCDAILAGDSASACAGAAKLAGKAEIGSLLSLLGLLRYQVVALGRASTVLRRGGSAAEAIQASRARLRGPAQGAMAKVARGLSRDGVRGALLVLLEADEALKSSAPDAAALLVSVVAGLCRTLHRKPGTD